MKISELSTFSSIVLIWKWPKKVASFRIYLLPRRVAEKDSYECNDKCTEEILHWGGGSVDTLESVVHIMLVAHVTQATQVNSATVGALPADSFQW